MEIVVCCICFLMMVDDVAIYRTKSEAYSFQFMCSKCCGDGVFLIGCAYSAAGGEM